MITTEKKMRYDKGYNRFSPWLMWGLGAAFFFAEYYARVAPSVMAEDLMSHFNVGAFALGSLSAFFYYAYVSMQLPVGMLMDRFGPHRLLTITTLTCAVGSIIFAFAPHIYIAYLGRLLMGFGAAFAFVGSLKLASIWFPASRFGLMAGMTQALGMLGAATGDGPMAIVVAHIGWQQTMCLISVIFLLLAIAIHFLVKDTPKDHPVSQEQREKIGLMSSLVTVLKNPQSWWNGLYVGLVYAPTAAFGELWGVSFLKNSYHMSLYHAALGIGFIFIGWGIGGPITGWLSDRMRRRKPLMFVSGLCGFVLMTLIIFVPMPVWLVYLTLFLYGMTNTGVAISYALSSEINPTLISGTSMAFANMASVLVGALFQPLIGYLLVSKWNGLKLAGSPVYQLADYQHALIILPVCLFAGVLSLFFIKETYCQPVE